MIAVSLPEEVTSAPITQAQALGIRVLYGQLGRAVPELIDLTWLPAGDLIVELRAELLERQGRAER